MSDVGTDQPDIPAYSGSTGLDDLLATCRQEMEHAIGFENDAELNDARQRALDYFKGDMSRDVPSYPNRSKAVSTDLTDAVETILPDLLEIFTGGDDVVAFIPESEQDVEAADQETKYISHVVFHDNPGFLILYTAIKDALLCRTGVLTWEWQESSEEQVDHLTGKGAVEIALASVDGEVSDVEQDGIDPVSGAPTYSLTVTKTKDTSRAVCWPVPPEDFAAAPDTVNIADATYCVMRTRPRVQDLIGQGYDAAKVRALPTYEGPTDSAVKMARDTSEETSVTGGADQTGGDLRQVEVRKHYIRVLGDDGKTELWCLVSDWQATQEIHREQVDEIPFAVGSPYLTTHHLIGRSIADVLGEICRIKTALTRAVLDSAYFAQNQRYELNINQASDFTMSDLLQNEPGVPVRTRGGALTPMANAGVGFDAYGALEYFSTVGEQRTGIVRNAQGLNPDTLHDTASGALALMSAAQRRTRFIARVLAETLIKPFYVGLHACIRSNAKDGYRAMLTGSWTPIDPTVWADRRAMSVEVGLGAAGKDMELASMQKILMLQQQAVTLQGGANGPLVTMENLYASAIDYFKKMGVKAPQEYVTDPKNAPPQQPQLSPDVLKAQQQAQLQQSQMQQEAQMQQQKQQADAALTMQKAQMDSDAKKYQVDQEIALKREQMAAELALKREQMNAQMMMQERISQNASIGSVQLGGDPG